MLEAVIYSVLMRSLCRAVHGTSHSYPAPVKHLLHLHFADLN